MNENINFVMGPGLVAFYFWRQMKRPSANTETEKCAEKDAEKMVEIVSVDSENNCDQVNKI